MRIGRVVEIVRYPVKSMAGVVTHTASVGWHGLEGDRRFAFRRTADASGFPFLTASRLPELILYQPVGFEEGSDAPQPTHVRTPSGTQLALWSRELVEQLSERLGTALEFLQYRNGVFDEGTVSVICPATIARIGDDSGVVLDRRRFRANLVVETDADQPFVEDTWLGQTLVFGGGESGAALNVTLRDERCMMINLDPDTAKQDARVMKAVVRLNGNTAGVYATVVRRGLVRVGDVVHLVGQPPH